MVDWLRTYCLSFPHASEVVQWDSLVFKVAGKIFAIAALEPASKYVLSIKCDPDKFPEMVERPGIAPAPYLARAQWIAFENEDAISHAELKELIRESYELVWAKLPKKTKEELTATPAKASPAQRPQRRK